MNIEYDKNLWFYYKGCEGKHYLLGNPHTFRGRMWAWCELKQRSFFVSKGEMEACSEQAKYWVAGFLSGNEPAPPETQEGEVDFTSPEYKIWRQSTQVFNQTGFWPEDESKTTEA